MTDNIFEQLHDTFLTKEEIFDTIPGKFKLLKTYAQMRLENGYHVGDIKFLTANVLLIFWKQNKGYTIELMPIPIPSTALKAWEDTGIILEKSI